MARTTKPKSKGLEWLMDIIGDVLGPIFRRQEKRLEGVEGRLDEIERPTDLGQLKNRLAERIEKHLTDHTKH